MTEAAKSWLALGVALAACFGAAAAGGLATSRSVGTWYLTLHKPTWTPPSWLFGPVWTLLYAMMAVAAWLVWRKAGSSARTAALALFGVQLLLNALWSGLFFGLRNPGAAFADIVLLWLALSGTVAVFFRVTAWAGWLLVPYFLWTTFAAVLNFSIWRLNA